jgi:hypothetical protein
MKIKMQNNAEVSAHWHATKRAAEAVSPDP